MVLPSRKIKIEHQLLYEIIQLCQNYTSVSTLNQILFEKTKIQDFFNENRPEDIQTFVDLIQEPGSINRLADTSARKEFGDFQTSLPLAISVCNKITQFDKIRPEILIEPTCGIGNFVIASLKTFDSISKVLAIDINPVYEWLFKVNLLLHYHEFESRPTIIFKNSSLFDIDFKQYLKVLGIKKEKNILQKNRILCIGNLPWVTNTNLSKLNSKNLPKKVNAENIRGIEALTGKSNFDISESIFRYMVRQISWAHFCFFLKLNVAVKLIKQVQKDSPITFRFKMFKFDVKKNFNVKVASSLLMASPSNNRMQTSTVINVFALEDPENQIIYSFGYYNMKFVSNIDQYKKYMSIDGKSQLEWRQGVKHDATKVFVLRFDQNKLYNGYKEEVNIELKHVNPLIKGSSLKGSLIDKTTKFVIITQKKIGEDTTHLKKVSPKLWAYLESKKTILDKRKSRIYQNQPLYAIFGIGPYSFKPYKIAIAGFNKEPQFTLILPSRDKQFVNKPIMVDDTSYLLSFDQLSHTIIVWCLLNSQYVKHFLESITFIENKRPFTKEVLMRIDLEKLNELITNDQFISIFKRKVPEHLLKGEKLNLDYIINVKNHFSNLIDRLI